MVTLEAIRADARAATYPCDVLEGCETALVLFAAAWHGKQDAIHMEAAGLSTTCVDLDEAKLGEMSSLYPSDWTYVTADVFDFAWTAQDRWSVVSLDCPTNLFDKCAAWLPTWCALARKAVVLGTDLRSLEVPDGWRESERRCRSNFRGGVYWAVLERTA